MATSCGVATQVGRSGQPGPPRDSVEAAKREIEIYFQPSELVEYTPTLAEWTAAPDEV